MPRAKHKAGLFLGVSPWQDAQASRPAGKEPGEASTQQPGYSVVELPLVVAAAPAAAAAAAATAGPASMPLDAQPGSQPTAPAPAPSGGWQAMKRKPAADEAHAGAAGAAEAGGGTCLLSDRPTAGVAGGEQPPAEPTQLELEGTAYLALLPNGNITGAAALPDCPYGLAARRTPPPLLHFQAVRQTGPPLPSQHAHGLTSKHPIIPRCLPGHLVCPPSIFRPGRRSFGLMAEAVLAGRECTRDAGEGGEGAEIGWPTVGHWRQNLRLGRAWQLALGFSSVSADAWRHGAARFDPGRC